MCQNLFKIAKYWSTGQNERYFPKLRVQAMGLVQPWSKSFEAWENA